MVELYSDDTCLVAKEDGLVWLNVNSTWSPAAAALARRFKIRGLALLLPGKGQSLDFLSQFPQLHSLQLSGGPALPWNKIEVLSELKSAAQFCDAGKPPAEIDFTRLKKLARCRMSWNDNWASVLHVKRLRELAVHDSDDLRQIDCTALNALQQLTILGCTGLQAILLNESAKLRRLWINNSPKLKLDWKRVGRDLEQLTIIGKVASPLEELRHAKELIRLALFGVKRISSIDFLRELPKLYFVETDADLSKAGVALIDTINETAFKDRKKRGRRQEN